MRRKNVLELPKEAPSSPNILPSYLTKCALPVTLYIYILQVNLSTYLPVILPICLTVSLSIYLSVILHIYLPVNLSIYLPVSLHIYLPVNLPNYLGNCAQRVNLSAKNDLLVTLPAYQIHGYLILRTRSITKK